LLTVDPSADVAPIHDRQMVVLEGADWFSGWSTPGTESELLRALPAGSLNVEQVRA
jgi:putative SOS response-associated peptidase YedK